ncbi:MAG: hypothetical protein SFW35_12125 [Chitinophagales bacterium]|nr:hypothetical protein [Chitinophagales bacterium]
MKTYKIIVLVVNSLVEGMVAILMLANPNLMVEISNAEMLARSFSMGALSICFLGISMIIWQGKEITVAGLAILSIYHTGIGIIQSIDPSGKFPPMAIALFHGWLVMSFLLLLWQTLRQNKQH